MDYPAVIRSVLGALSTEAVLNTGLSADSLARAVLEAAGQRERVGELGLIKAEPLPERVGWQVVSLVRISQLRKSQPVVKAEPKAKTPPDLHGPPAQRPPIVQVAPAKAPVKVKRLMPKRTSITVGFSKAEAARRCRRCDVAAFEKGEFVGCTCWSELAQSATTKVTAVGYVVSLPLTREAIGFRRELARR